LKRFDAPEQKKQPETLELDTPGKHPELGANESYWV
jgi:hypothetical protein